MTNSETPLVSVIICFFNVDQYVADAVNSVLEQDYRRWEMILVDDGSTDNSTTIAREYVRQHPAQIRYVEHEGHVNRGSSASRNVGVGAAVGQLIAFLDADDIWLPNKLSAQVALMQRHPQANVLLEATVYWYSWSDSGKQDVFKQVGAEQDRLYAPPQLMHRLYPLGAGEAPSMSGLMVETRLAQHYTFDEAFTGMYDDQVFLSKLYLHANIYVTSTCCHRYRQRAGSIMRTSEQTGDYNQIRRFFLQWLKSYLRSEQITDITLRRLLWTAQFTYRFPLSYRALKKLSGYFPNHINKIDNV